MGGRGPVPPPPPRLTPSIHGLRKYPSAFGIDHPVSTKPRSRIYTPDGAGFEQALLHSIGKAWVVEDLTRRHHQVSLYFQPVGLGRNAERVPDSRLRIVASTDLHVETEPSARTMPEVRPSTLAFPLRYGLVGSTNVGSPEGSLRLNGRWSRTGNGVRYVRTFYSPVNVGDERQAGPRSTDLPLQYWKGTGLRGPDSPPPPKLSSS